MKPNRADWKEMGNVPAFNMVPALCFCVMFHLAVTSNAENVLISTSVGEGSHYFVGKTVGKYLVKQGHNVTVLLSNAYANRAENPDDAELNFIIFNHSVSPESVRERHRGYSQVALQPVGVSYIWQLLQSQRQGSVDDCDDLLSRNPDVMRQIEDGNFSVVIFDQIWTCSFFLALKLETKAVMCNPMSVISMISTIIGNPISLAVTPATMTGFTHPMTFFQRVNNVLVSFGMQYVLLYYNAPFNDLRTRYQIRPDLTGSVFDLVATYSDLFLMNLDFAVEFPAALNPNIIPIGGITATPAKPLPEDLEEFMQSSGDEGVIMFTLGSYILDIRSDFLQIFADVFEKFPQRVIWQLRGKPDFELPKNVKTMPWLPQNDILGHPKLRLFIFHGGNNGFYEAQYHGVPVVVIPLSGDAVDAGTRVKHRGFGVVIDKTAVSTETLRKAIETVLNNDSYVKVAKHQSELLRSRAMHPGDRAAFWISHVIKHGGQYMKNPALELNFIQRNLLDVTAFLLAVIICVLLLIIYIIRCAYRCCKRLCFRSKEKRE